MIDNRATFSEQTSSEMNVMHDKRCIRPLMFKMGGAQHENDI
jgi:hypothetical protein